MDTIIKKLYESYAVGRIGEERFDNLLAGYEQEQMALRQSITEVESALNSFEQDTANVEHFLALTKKYTDFSELTTPMINEFIEKIIVHAPDRFTGDRVQEVDIYLKYIGRFEAPVAPPATRGRTAVRPEKQKSKFCKITEDGPELISARFPVPASGKRLKKRCGTVIGNTKIRKR